MPKENNLHTDNFDLDKSYNKLWDILKRPQVSESASFKTMQDVRHLLVKINREGYEEGFLTANNLKFES